ncbi:MAG: recombination protein RecR [Parcubacteria group bacterium Athens0714_26]|nr:MAG: recombination protein RecR [Parcubacteria group bacterium Athens1014_26]TSD03676.1 MAG: recombination protein RecR [Parcubacteria group bacterium Athens0714_26]
MLSDPIKKFSDLFSKLPSIGPRQAIRLAFHITTLGNAKIRELADSIDGLSKMATCANCFSIYHAHHEGKNICEICLNEHRRKDIIAIVEKETDLISLERTKKFNGRYLVIGNLQKTGILDSEQKLRLNSLKKFINKDLNGKSAEIIIAFNPTTYGDLNAAMLASELKNFTEKITRLGRGIPTGGEIEFADEETLEQSIDRRI